MTWRIVVGIGVILAALCLLAYFPFRALPLISDDYVQIDLARKFGPVSGWDELARDALYRCRATSLVLSYWVDRSFGIGKAFWTVDLLLHVVNCWLIALLGRWPRLGWQWSVTAAGFFAVYEGHQEAVVWHAAVPELLVFLFCLLAMHAWLDWIRSGKWWQYAACWIAFLLALLSKESGVVVPALLLVVAVVEGRSWKSTIPMFAIGVVYAGLSFAASRSHLHFNDGTFSLSAPFPVTIVNSLGRMLWFWGLLAVLSLMALRSAYRWRLLAMCGVLALICLTPYSFLTYMPRVPSRHTYLASAALAVLVGAALCTARIRFRTATMVVAAMIVAHNCGYLWTRKYDQYLQRAQPTERLLDWARTHQGPVWIECFPYGVDVAWATLTLHGLRRPEEIVKQRPEGAVVNQYCDRSNI